MLATKRRPATPNTRAACKPCSMRSKTQQLDRREAPLATRRHRARASRALHRSARARVRRNPRCARAARSGHLHLRRLARSDLPRRRRLRRGGRRGDATAKTTWRSAPCVRPAITPSRSRRWAFAFSTTSPSRAMHALEAHGLSRVAVIDFDVHHGNGTQTIAEKEPRLFFASTHQSPLYPGTGAPTKPASTITSSMRRLPAGAGSARMARARWRRACCPRSMRSRPN